MSLKDSVLNVVIKAKDKASGSITKIIKALKRSEKSADTAGASFKRLGARLAALAGTYLGIQALKNAFEGIVSTGAKFEKFEAQLEQVMGSIQGGKDATKWIKQFTLQTPYQLDQVTQGFIKLKAFGIDPMDGTYQAIAKQAAALGGSQETLNGIILATGQAWAKSKLQGEEILQLVERGVPVWDLLAKATGKSVTELQKMSSAGELGRKQIKLLIDEMNKANEGALQKQMGTLNGMISNAKDYWTQFVATIADSGLKDYVKKQLGALISEFKKLKQEGKLKEWAQQISTAFINLSKTITGMVKDIAGDTDTLGTRVSSGLNKINTAVKVTSAGIKLFVSGLSAAFDTAVIAEAKFQNKILSMSAKLANAFGLDKLAANLKLFADSAKETAAKYAQALRDQRDNVTSAAKTLGQALVSESAKAGKKAGKNYAKAGEDAKQSLEKSVADAKAKTAALSKQYDAVKKAVADAADASAKAWANATNSTAKNHQAAVNDLKKKIKTENKLRQKAAHLAQQYNQAVADSEKLVAQEAEKQNRAQAKAAQSAKAELQRLGIDTGLAFNKIKTSAKNSIQALDQIAADIKKIPHDSDQAARAFEQAIGNALKNVSNSKELKAIRKKVQNLFDSGQIDGSQLNAALEKIRKKAKTIEGAPLDKPGKKLAQGMKKADQAIDKASQKIDQLKAKGDSLSSMQKHQQAIGSQVAGIINGITNSVWALGKAAGMAYENLAFGRKQFSSAEKLQNSYNKAAADAERLVNVQRKMNDQNLIKYFVNLDVKAARVKKEYYRQRIELKKTMDAVKSGGMSMTRLSQLADNADKRFNLLGKNKLQGLRSAIQSAQQEMQQLNRSAESTLVNLQNQLDQLKGNQQAVEQRQYEQQKARLERQLKAAQQKGANQAVHELRQSINVLDQIHHKKMQQIHQEAQAQRKADQQHITRQKKIDQQQAASKRQQSVTTGPQQQDTGVTATHRIVITPPNGKDVSVTTSDPNGFLQALEQAGVRSQS